MAAPSGHLKTSRYFAAIIMIIAVIYAQVFFLGDKKAKPKLGLDLQGGTSMTLSATHSKGSTPARKSLEQARDIIADRVNLTGVTESEVVIEGDKNIVVNVAGGMKEEELRTLVAPAVLRFRKVLKQTDATTTTAQNPSESPSPSGSATPSGAPPSAAPSGVASATPAASAAPATSQASAAPQPAASGSAPSSAKPSASASTSEAPASPIDEAKRDEVIKKLGPVYKTAQDMIGQGMIPGAEGKPVGNDFLEMLSPFGKLSSEEVAALPVDVQYSVPTISCEQLNSRPAGSVAEPKYKIAACDSRSSTKTKYLLDVAKVLGEDVDGANFENDPQEGWKVNLKFKSSGQDKWTALTKEAYNNGAKEQVAIVLDNRIVSAPSIESVISGDAQISGKFSKKEVDTLSRQLKYGSLPLSFKVESVDDVTATIGTQAMRMGLVAGAIGLALVIVYCLLYYRALCLVVVSSLLVSGAIVYGMLVLVGRHMGFALTLAGIAGFIVAIGITADSFIVFFERLKDEVKDGRTVRSAVPRAWVRARRTILSADTVSFLAALVLFILAVGPVKGFAFTLGMSTLIDVIIVFLFTHPLVAVLSRANAFTSPRFSGLGNMRSDKAIAASTSAPRLGAMRPKES